MTRKLSELSHSHYVNEQERTSLSPLKRLQKHIFQHSFFLHSESLGRSFQSK